MFEAREFLRKKLIGQSVHVTVDYIQAANNDFPEKTCATVTIGKTIIKHSIKELFYLASFIQLAFNVF